VGSVDRRARSLGVASRDWVHPSRGPVLRSTVAGAACHVRALSRRGAGADAGRPGRPSGCDVLASPRPHGAQGGRAPAGERAPVRRARDPALRQQLGAAPAVVCLPPVRARAPVRHRPSPRLGRETLDAHSGVRCLGEPPRLVHPRTRVARDRRRRGRGAYGEDALGDRSLRRAHRAGVEPARWLVDGRARVDGAQSAWARGVRLRGACAATARRMERVHRVEQPFAEDVLGRHLLARDAARAPRRESTRPIW